MQDNDIKPGKGNNPNTNKMIGLCEAMRTLKDVKIGETAKISKVEGEGPVRRRIMDMGITKGVEVYIRKVAPLGDPVELTVRGYELSVRRADAELIRVE